MNKKTNYCYFLLFILFFTTYGYFFQGGGWNQNARICLTRAIVHQHTFIIDDYKEDSHNPPFEFVNTGDWSYRDGHYYSNKSPGLSFLAVVPFSIAECFLNCLFPSDREKQVHLSAYVSTLCTTGLCSTLLCLLLFYVGSHFLRLDEKRSVILTLFFGFGTLGFSYSTTFYGHLPAAFFSFLSCVLVMRIKHDDPQKKKGIALGAGFSAATAVLVEPSTVLTLICIVGYLVSFREGRRCILFFLLGCIPPGIVQCFYNAVCFGSPLSSSYYYTNEAVTIKVKGEFFGFPQPENIIKILLSPQRGLFVSSPVFLMMVPGMVVFFKRKKWVPETVLCTSVAVVFTLWCVSYYAWYHASTPGPRYLLPAFPFGFLLIASALSRFPKTFKVLGCLSVLINLTITLVGNEIPHDLKNPLSDFILHHLVAGRVSVNPVPFSHFEHYSIETLSDMEKWKPNFNAFNLGEIIFPDSVLSILPLLCFWVIWGYVLWKRCLTPVEGDNRRQVK